jgi:hypothetical protein
MLFSPEQTGVINHLYPEHLSLLDLLALDLPEMKSRIAEYKERARQADRVVITVVCCDSRVVLPEKLVTINKKDGSTERVLFITVPTIGSGAPSKSRLRGIQQQIEKDWGVAAEKVSFLVTQHGDAHEVSAQHDETDHAITCGLRKVLLNNNAALGKLSEWLASWTQEYKMKNRDFTLAPDRMTLDQLRQEAPEIMALVDEIHESSGAVGARLPRRLIIRAAYRNHHSNMALNEASVVAKVHEYVISEQQRKAAETNALYPVGYAAYNHQTKELLFDNPYACFGWEDSVALPELPPRTDAIQSPEYSIISFGTQTIPLAVRELLPHLCGSGSEKYTPPADNAFRTVASIATEATLLCALAEAMYAILHKVHQHHGDMNFADLKKVVIVCDNDEYVAVVKKLLQYPEFVEEYLPAFKELQPEGLIVVNLHLDKSELIAEQEVIGY